MSVVRRWATLRGERCLTTVIGGTAPYTLGEELTVGTRAYVVTRVLRARTPTAEHSWEIWGRRVPGRSRVDEANAEAKGRGRRVMD